MIFPKYPFLTFIKYVLGFFEILLGIRLVLRLLSANPAAPIVDLLYVLTGVIIAPFQNIFSNVSVRGGGVFDIVTLTAMICYPIIVYLFIELVHIITKDRGHEEKV